MVQPIGIVITDTHLSDDTIDINKSIFGQVFDLCKQLNLQTIFVAGDIFTSRKGQSQDCLNCFKDILDLAGDRGLMIIAIAGNHDKTRYTDSKSFLDAFDGHKAFTVVNSDFVYSVKNLHIHFLPYYDEHLGYVERLQNLEIDSDMYNILITHVAIDGVRNNSGTIVEGEVSDDLFDRFNLVLVGHYHDRQVVGKRQNIVYIGSTHQSNFGEDEYKGATIIHEDGSIKPIQLDFPKYITVDLLPEDISSDIIDKAKQKSEESYVRFCVAGDITEDKKHLLLKAQQSGIKVKIEKESYTPINVWNVDNDKLVMSDSNIIEYFKEWGDKNKIDDLDIGLQLLKMHVK